MTSHRAKNKKSVRNRAFRAAWNLKFLPIQSLFKNLAMFNMNIYHSNSNKNKEKS